MASVQATPERLREILALDLSETMVGQDAGVGTVRGLLYELTAKVWAEDEGFNGKRPWGNSGWKSEVYGLIAERGWCEAKEEFGEMWPVDERAVDTELIEPAIRLLMLGGDPR